MNFGEKTRKAICFAVTTALLVAGLVLPTAMTASAATYTVPLRGDVNLDGKISAADVTLLRQQQAGLATFSPLQTLAADVNKDGNVSATDVTLLRQVMANISGRTISDTYFIKNKASGNFLTVPGNGGNGMQVKQTAFTGAANQRWLLEFSSGIYHIKPMHNTGAYLEESWPVKLGGVSSLNEWGVEGNGDEVAADGVAAEVDDLADGLDAGAIGEGAADGPPEGGEQ